MRKYITLSISSIFIIALIIILYVTGQQHTLIINNIYSNKDLSKKIIIQYENNKQKKLKPNKKTVIKLKGTTHHFTIITKDKTKNGIINFKINKNAQLMVEKYLDNQENWLEIMPQY